MYLYEGDKPYIYVSYAHKDLSSLKKLVDAMERVGLRVWCDIGVEAGSYWLESIEEHFLKSRVVLALVSKAYIASQSCTNELAWAVSKGIPVVSLFLETVTLPLGLQLQLADCSAFHKENFSSWNTLAGSLLSHTEIRQCQERGETKTTEWGEKPEWDEKLEEAVSYALDVGKITTAALQRRFFLGYARAARIIDSMEKIGIISESEGAKPRRVLVTKEEAAALLARCQGDPEPEPIPEETPRYTFPPITLLKESEPTPDHPDPEEVRQNGDKLLETLKSFRVDVEIVNVTCGPRVIRYEIVPKKDMRIQRFMNIADDIALGLGVSGVRIEAPIPGKTTVGIEVPRQQVSPISFGSLAARPDFQNAESKLTACLGVDVTGAPVWMDLAKMPHLLIAGSTGMGKTVCLNTIITSLLLRNTPEELKLILIDPKKVEFYLYRDLPHLVAPVITQVKRAIGALISAVNEMESRLELMRSNGVRTIKDYNALAASDPSIQPLPNIVIIIDELADLMLYDRSEVERYIVQLAQKSRAAGIHLILSTQRPTVDVITGMIKANIPSRIAFTLYSAIDSRTVLDQTGAEKLFGQGDMLYAPVGSQAPIRVQGALLSDGEITAVVDFIRYQADPVSYDDEVKRSLFGTDPLDECFADAVSHALAMGVVSSSLLQRRLSIGYGRAVRILDSMEALGIIGQPDGQKPRKIILPKDEIEAKLRSLGLSLVDVTPPAPAKTVKEKPTVKAEKTKPPFQATFASHTPSGIAAYEGDEPFVFVSYAHKDADRVLPILRELGERGFRLWFDENIETGGKWTMEIMRHVKNCAVFLAFVTPSYAQSSFCEREATTAMNKEKTMIALYLERFVEPDWLEFCFTLAQNIDCTRFSSTSAYLDKLTSSTEMQKCRNV